MCIQCLVWSKTMMLSETNMNTKDMIESMNKLPNKSTCTSHPKSVRLKIHESDRSDCETKLTNKLLGILFCKAPHRTLNVFKPKFGKVIDLRNCLKREQVQSKIKCAWRHKLALIIYLLLSHWAAVVVGLHSVLTPNGARKYSSLPLDSVIKVNEGNMYKDFNGNYADSPSPVNFETLDARHNSKTSSETLEFQASLNSPSDKTIADAQNVGDGLNNNRYDSLSENQNAQFEDLLEYDNSAPSQNFDQHTKVNYFNDRETNVNNDPFSEMKVISDEDSPFSRQRRDTSHNDFDGKTGEVFPFFVKNISMMQPRPNPHPFKDKVVKLAVILPNDAKAEFSLRKILPLIELASKAVTDPEKGILPSWDIQVDYRDSNCSSIQGPLAAFDFYVNGTADAFIGPGCEYVIAPVARYAGVWKIPVLTAGAHAEAFENKPDYPTLTRMMGGYKMVGQAVKDILKGFGWDVCGMMFHNFAASTVKGNSLCYLTVGAIFNVLDGKKKDLKVMSFDETNTTNVEYIDMLRNISKKARIVVVCANPLTVREIMLAAEELNMVSSGEYVFFNIELFSSLSSPSSLEPWRKEGDSEERNMKAKKAYTAMLTVTTRTPDDEEYLQFSAKVKDLASTKYNYTFGNESVTAFVTAFYDAVILYALALNETLKHHEGNVNVSLDSSEIIRRMWGRTFKGITGDVTIDSNGDRIASYILLDMHPVTGKFELVANYIAANRSLEYVPDRPIYWAGGRDKPPLDTPVCGFDGSLCPDKSVPGYAILSIVLSIVVVIVALISGIFYSRQSAGYY